MDLLMTMARLLHQLTHLKMNQKILKQLTRPMTQASSKIIWMDDEDFNVHLTLPSLRCPAFMPLSARLTCTEVRITVIFVDWPHAVPSRFSSSSYDT
ncbi:hypothetical protein MTO96_048135 [Rhipicephalus appendiculatus]